MLTRSSVTRLRTVGGDLVADMEAALLRHGQRGQTDRQIRSELRHILILLQLGMGGAAPAEVHCAILVGWREPRSPPEERAPAIPRPAEGNPRLATSVSGDRQRPRFPAATNRVDLRALERSQAVAVEVREFMAKGMEASVLEKVIAMPLVFLVQVQV